MRKSGNLAYLILCGGIFALDQGIKYKVKNSIAVGASKKPEEISARRDRRARAGSGAVNGGNSADASGTGKNLTGLASGKLLFHNSRNFGACLNLGEKHPEAVKKTAAALTAGSAAGFLVSLGQKRGKRSLKLGLSMLTGGALSNLADRYRDGYVTDYVSFPKAPGKMKQIIYNIGDFAIGAGALLVAASQFSDNK